MLADWKVDIVSIMCNLVCFVTFDSSIMLLLDYVLGLTIHL